MSTIYSYLINKTPEAAKAALPQVMKLDRIVGITRFASKIIAIASLPCIFFSISSVRQIEAHHKDKGHFDGVNDDLCTKKSCSESHEKSMNIAAVSLLTLMAFGLL